MTLALATLGACGGGESAVPEVPASPACADPARGPQMGRFADATANSGVDFVYTTTGFQGGGLAVVDLDGDGLPDLVAGRRGGGLALWKNLGELRFGVDPRPLSEEGGARKRQDQRCAKRQSPARRHSQAARRSSSKPASRSKRRLVAPRGSSPNTPSYTQPSGRLVASDADLSWASALRAGVLSTATRLV